MGFYTGVLTATIISGISLYLKFAYWLWIIQPLASFTVTLIIILVILIVYQLSKKFVSNESPN